jgi:hypothetical protein
MLTCVDQPDEIWTEAPIESDEDDEELVVALKDRSEQDVDDSTARPLCRGPCVKLEKLVRE